MNEITTLGTSLLRQCKTQSLIPCGIVGLLVHVIAPVLWLTLSYKKDYPTLLVHIPHGALAVLVWHFSVSVL